MEEDRPKEITKGKIKLSVVVPCFNEQNTLKECINRVRSIADTNLILEIIIVDDFSSDSSGQIGKALSEVYSEIIFIQHSENKGKGAALRTGFYKATGDFLAIQDADLEYDPQDIKKLLVPLINNNADVVIGSRFLAVGPHRVLYFWHSMGNKLLTFLSNMFSDLNLTDMEAGYKIFKKEVIKQIEIEENGFGFEPEIIAKISHMKLRIYEMGISYFGRTYEEGKKINYKDGLRAFYCIFKYNMYYAPVPTKIFIYSLAAAAAIVLNILCFLQIRHINFNLEASIFISFIISTIIIYPLVFFNILGKNKKILKSYIEFFIFISGVLLFSYIDIFLTKIFLGFNISLMLSKISSLVLILIFNFFIRKLWISPVGSKTIRAKSL